MFVKDANKLIKIITELKLVNLEQLDLVRIESARTGKPIEEVLIEMSLLGKEDLVKTQAISLDVPYVDLSAQKVDQNILKNITKELASKFLAVPFGFSGGMLSMAMANPNNVQVIDFVERKSGFRVNPYMASEESIKAVIEQYQDAKEEVSEVLRSIDIKQSAGEYKAGSISKDVIQDAPVTRAVNTILEYAVKSRASDIHIEPREKNIKIRYRIDGVLQDTMSLPLHIHAALVSHIKILSALKIDEHRVPQDGRFQVNFDNREIDIRISISPLIHGEKVVMRLLDKTSGIITLEQLGVRGRAFKIIEKGSKKPHGMLLSTGPTGSGKSTTLYAILSKMNAVGVNIITLEDPVEYHINGVNQIQVNAQVGLTFASGLRSVLRQDPDIIMVGEIRDPETAGLAIQSALTGHTVLTTLHTNSAAGVLPRFLDMDIEPFLIASTVNTIIGQRLVRLICAKCKEKYKASEVLTGAIKKVVGELLPGGAKEEGVDAYKDLPSFDAKEFYLYRGKGCDDCGKSGFKGRIGIFEVFEMNPEMEKLLVGRATTSEIHNTAVKYGMITMRQDGFLKSLEGLTTIEEVIRYASD